MGESFVNVVYVVTKPNADDGKYDDVWPIAFVTEKQAADFAAEWGAGLVHPIELPVPMPRGGLTTGRGTEMIAYSEKHPRFTPGTPGKRSVAAQLEDLELASAIADAWASWAASPQTARAVPPAARQAVPDSQEVAETLRLVHEQLSLPGF